MDNRKAAHSIIYGLCCIVGAIIFGSIILRICCAIAAIIFFVASAVLCEGEVAQGLKYTLSAVVVGFFVFFCGYVCYSVKLFMTFSIIAMVLGVILAVGGVVFTVIILYYMLKPAPQAPTPTYNYQNQNTVYTEQYSRPIDDGEKNYDLLEKVHGENVLKYSYEKDICLFEYGYTHLAGNGGKTLKFVQEPDNPYDSEAVAIYLGANKIGYVYRNDKVQKMINDWIRRGEYFTGYLNKFSVADKKATFKIGFYKPLSCYPSKTYSLVRTGKKIDDFETRAGNLLECDVGDCVSVSSSYSDSYVVFQYDCTAEIGELPKSAENFLGEYDDKDIIGVIREIDDENEAAPKAKVEIYVTG